MKDKIQMRKIGISIIIFFLISILVTSPMKIKINALEEEKANISQYNTPEYTGDAYDEETEKINDDIVVKIICKLDSSIDINFVNKYDLVDEENNPYTSIELSVSGDLDKIQEIEKILNDMKLNYKIDNMDIKNRKNENGIKIDNYVDCVMTFKVD